MNNNTEIDLQFILSLIKEYGGVKRLGHIFQTPQNEYYYDSGTGKVICLESDEYAFLKWLFNEENNHTYENFQLHIGKNDVVSNMRKVISDEHLFKAPFKNHFISPPHKEDLDEAMQSKMQMITLELTEKCNLRCEYCIYNDRFDKVRQFSENEMSIETVKTAIDLLAKNGEDEIAITFYGGEPLLRFDLIKYAVEYAQKSISDKKLIFSMTSNMTLMTKEMANFFASVDGFSVVCSIDGPEDVHNSYRRYANGAGSFNDAFQGLKYLAESCIERYGSNYETEVESRIQLSMVFAPPFTREKASKIQKFFDDISDWLPSNVVKTVSYTERGTVDESIFLKYGEKITDDNIIWDPLIDWTMDGYDNQEGAQKMFSKKIMTDTLLRIHNRPLLVEPDQAPGLNGCCVPGLRRSYICANGDIKPCEKMGICPSIGNVYTGLNKNRIAKIYVDDYEKESIQDCNDCWAYNICGVCYMKCYSELSFDIEKKRKKCAGALIQASGYLVLYHHILETAPETLNYLNDVVIT